MSLIKIIKAWHTVRAGNESVITSAMRGWLWKKRHSPCLCSLFTKEWWFAYKFSKLPICCFFYKTYWNLSCKSCLCVVTADMNKYIVKSNDGRPIFQKDTGEINKEISALTEDMRMSWDIDHWLIISGQSGRSEQTAGHMMWLFSFSMASIL